ncbi:MAG TPA: GGDEF domain-containing protein [Thiopseudomonas sp.]|nr:GGDEF domain-containing protein [Thiopseudomonas sp.]
MPLTGIGNRSAMQQTLQRDIHTAVRQQQLLSVLMIDIDHFKRINDRHGHSAGDHVLTQVAQHIQQQLRATDALFRYGGEEFLAVLPNTAEHYAVLVARRILDHLALLKIQSEQHNVKVTASIGCAVLAETDTVDSLLRRSDRALYKAKNNGRNQVQVAP